MYVCVITWFSISILLLFCPSKLNKQFSPNNLTGIKPRLFAVSSLLALAVGTWLKKTTLTPGEDKTAQAGLVLECKHALPVWLSTYWNGGGVCRANPCLRCTQGLCLRERERKRGEREKTGREGGGKGKEKELYREHICRIVPYINFYQAKDHVIPVSIESGLPY